MIKRGEEVPRPRPWRVVVVDSRAAKGWADLVSQAPEAADRAWVAMTSNPRRTDSRQHQLRSSLGEVTVNGHRLDQWQLEPTGSGRVWYAIDDEQRTLWITEAGPGHPKQTERPRRRQR